MVNLNTLYGFLFAIISIILIYVLIKRKGGGKEYGEYTEQEDFRADGDDRTPRSGEQSNNKDFGRHKDISKISYTDGFEQYYCPKRVKGEVVFTK